MEQIELYKVDANQAVRLWRIIAEDNVLIIQHGLANGQLQTETNIIELNKSGRTLAQQVALEMQSRINKQKDKGYCESIEEAIDSKGLNASGLLRPMLAHKIRDVKIVDWANAFVQYKYNGHRCMITRQQGKLIAYSRNGKPINSIDHILQNMDWLPEGMTVDGELYCHGVALQTISSWVRKTQPDSRNLYYIIFDVVTAQSFCVRKIWLEQNVPQEYENGLVLAPTFRFAESVMPLKMRTEEAIANGYEGLIIRDSAKGYEVGKRSQSLIKVKQSLDAEFCILGVDKSKDGWAIFECYKYPGRYIGRSIIPGDDEIFRVTAPGTHAEKVAAFETATNYVGKMLTVEFFEWTKDKKPFHPVAIGLRTSD